MPLPYRPGNDGSVRAVPLPHKPQASYHAANINALVLMLHGKSAAAGWWNDPKTGADLKGYDWFPYVVGTKLMLMVSEIAEGMEGHRKGLMDDKLPHTVR